MTNITIQVQDQQAKSALQSLSNRLANPAPLMAGIAAELLSQTEKAFEDQGQDGNKWQRLAASTISQRSRKGHWPGKMLQVSPGGLAASIHTSHSATQATIAAAKPYAAIHQFGGQAGKGKKAKIPARPYLPIKKEGSDVGLTPAAQKSVLAIMSGFLGGDFS